MCEAIVFLVKDGREEEIMENVVSIKPEENKVLLVGLFGEKKLVEGKIKEVKLLEHKVFLEE